MERFKKFFLRALIVLVFVCSASPSMNVEAMGHSMDMSATVHAHEDVPSAPMMNCEKFCVSEVCIVQRKVVLTNERTDFDDVDCQSYELEGVFLKDVSNYELRHYECRDIPILIGSYQDRTILIV